LLKFWKVQSHHLQDQNLQQNWRAPFSSLSYMRSLGWSEPAVHRPPKVALAVHKTWDGGSRNTHSFGFHSHLWPWEGEAQTTPSSSHLSPKPELHLTPEHRALGWEQSW
jgi:hypothetical protein